MTIESPCVDGLTAMRAWWPQNRGVVVHDSRLKQVWARRDVSAATHWSMSQASAAPCAQNQRGARHVVWDLLVPDLSPHAPGWIVEEINGLWFSHPLERSLGPRENRPNSELTRQPGRGILRAMDHAAPGAAETGLSESCNNPPINRRIAPCGFPSSPSFVVSSS